MNLGGRILLVEDEPGIVMTVGDRLLAAGYQVESAMTGEKALALVGRSPGDGPCRPDLVILDIMLPGMDGFEVCRMLRNRGFTMPILMLTAKGAVNDRVKGLKTGADDYLGKPFAMQELMARVEAQLRRSRTPSGDASPAVAPPAVAPPATTPASATGPDPTSATSPAVTGDTGSDSVALVRFGDWIFDQAGRSLRRVSQAADQATPLSTTEFRLLSVLVGNPGRVMSREELLDAAWGYNNETTSRTVDVHIAWLRTKLGEAETNRHIITIRRGGYKFLP